MRKLRIALAQINSTIGDIEGNSKIILQSIERAKNQGAQIVAFPELALTGYPPEDLLLKPSFIADNVESLNNLAAQVHGITAVVGFVDANSDIYNAAAVLHDGKIELIYHKQYLPNYGVFDEDRYFRAGAESPVFTLDDTLIGINICEDMWYPNGPAVEQSLGGAELIININASPYQLGKREFREKMLATRAADNGLMVAYVNMVGGQDELVFDGHSVIFDQNARLIAQGPQFIEALLIADLNIESVFRSRLHDPRNRKERWGHHELQPSVRLQSEPRDNVQSSPSIFAYQSGDTATKLKSEQLDGPAEVYAALVLGTRDYARKNGFRKALIGVSGGIDSSLVAAIAVDAIGADNVVGVSMPSRYSSAGSKDDARELADNLGMRLITIPIEGMFQSGVEALKESFAGTEPNVAEENLQARIRGTLWMALSNKFGYLMLTAGNKSEMATGYATLYGDMAGGFAVIKDCPKTLVYELARYRNTLGPVIPDAVLNKEPSAELRPNQKDSDSLPPYSVLDPILKAYVEEDQSTEEIVSLGFDRDVVKRVIRLVDRSEYKRRQAPPGVKITPRAFGRDRRLPITNRYSE